MLDTVGDGDILLADRAYDADALRIELAARGAWANIRPMPNRTRRPAFSAFLYRYRNLVDRFFSKLKQFRAVATRYDKRDDNFLASVQLAAMRLWLRAYESVPYRCLTGYVAAFTGWIPRRLHGAYDFARRLKTFSGLPPDGYIAKIWTS